MCFRLCRYVRNAYLLGILILMRDLIKHYDVKPYNALLVAFTIVASTNKVNVNNINTRMDILPIMTNQASIFTYRTEKTFNGIMSLFNTISSNSIYARSPFTNPVGTKTTQYKKNIELKKLIEKEDYKGVEKLLYLPIEAHKALTSKINIVEEVNKLNKETVKFTSLINKSLSKYANK